MASECEASSPGSIMMEEDQEENKGAVTAEPSWLEAEAEGGEAEAERTSRQETTELAAEAMRKLLEGPDPEEQPTSWNRLGLSVLSTQSRASRELRAHMLGKPVDGTQHEERPQRSTASPTDTERPAEEIDKGGRQRAQHAPFLWQHLDTFVAYEWMLQALLRRASGMTGGCQILVADVLLFSDGVPETWVFTNKFGKIDRRKFVERGDNCMWPRYTKTARRAAEVAADDFESAICARFSLSVQGVKEELLSASQLQDFMKLDAINRHQVIGLQIVVGPRSGKKRCARKSIVYKTEYIRKGLLEHKFAHTKEYEVSSPKQQAQHCKESKKSPRGQSSVLADAQQTSGTVSNRAFAWGGAPVVDVEASPFWNGKSVPMVLTNQAKGIDTKCDHAKRAARVSAAPLQALRQVVHSQASNRDQLAALTVRCARYVENSRGVVLQNLRGHYVQDSSNRIWLVGASNIKPCEGNAPAHIDRTPGLQTQAISAAQKEATRLAESLKRAQNVAEASMQAARRPPEQRKDDAHQAIFSELQGNHFLGQFPTVWQYEIAKTVEYKFVECGFEVYYNGDVVDEMYIIMRGSVRVILEPTCAVYCRTVDLSDKDTFAEQAITDPGTKICSRAVALEDTHLMVVKRKAVETVINRGRAMDRSRWHITKRQVDCCRRVLRWRPSERNILDLKLLMQNTINCDFFQNVPSLARLEMCSKATFKSVAPGKCLFTDMQGTPPIFFATVLRGSLTWSYCDPRLGDKVVQINGSGYLFSVGTATNTSDQDAELMVITKALWDNCVSAEVVSFQDTKALGNEPKEESGGSFFLTELDEEPSLISHEISATRASLTTGTATGGSLWAKARGVRGAVRLRNHEEISSTPALAFPHSATRSSATRSSPSHSRSQNAISPSNVVAHGTCVAHSNAAVSDQNAEAAMQRVEIPWAEMGKDEQLKLQKEKHMTCAVTGLRFPKSQQHTLQRRQVRDTALHLQKRNACSMGYDREKWLSEPKSAGALYDTFIVSPDAYAVYVMEQNLQDQEKMFARNLLNPALPKLSERRLPPSGVEKMTTRLVLAGMFIEFESFESPSALAHFGSKFDIRFRLCEEAIAVAFDLPSTSVPSGGTHFPINQTRMSYFFCADEGVNAYLTKQNMIHINLYNRETGALVATTEADLVHLANKVALEQSFRLPMEPTHQDLTSVLALEYVFLHLHVGCIKFREVEAKSFRLRRRHGLYLPSVPFITQCLPPDGWDPCNEEYIAKMAKGKELSTEVSAITMDGKLIPRSRQIQHLLQLGLSPDPGDSFAANRSKKHVRLSDGIAPAPIWCRKNYGDLPEKHDNLEKSRRSQRSLPPRPASAPIDQGLHRNQRRPPSSPAKHLASISKKSQSTSSRPTSAASNTTPKKCQQNTFDDGYRSEQSPRRYYESHATIPETGVRPASANVRERRPSSALIAARQRPSSALAAHSGYTQRSSSPTLRAHRLMASRPHSAMSNLAYSDNGSTIGTINELNDPAECEQFLRPFIGSEDFALSRSSSSSSLATNFGMPQRAVQRPVSAMSAWNGEDEKLEVNTQVVAAITRPQRKSLKGSKRTEAPLNQVPSFKPAVEMSKLVDVASNRGAGLVDISVAIQATNKAWRDNIMPLSALDADLKALDARSRLVAFRDRTPTGRGS